MMTLETVDTSSMTKSDDYFALMTVKHNSKNYQITYFFGHIYKQYESRVVLHNKYERNVISLNIKKDGNASYYKKLDGNILDAKLRALEKIDKYTAYIIKITCEDQSSKYNVIHPKSDMMWSISNNIVEIIQNNNVASRLKIHDTNSDTSISEVEKKLNEATSGSKLSVSYIDHNMRYKFLESYKIITNHRKQTILDVNGFQIKSKQPFIINKIFDF